MDWIKYFCRCHTTRIFILQYLCTYIYIYIYMYGSTGRVVPSRYMSSVKTKPVGDSTSVKSSKTTVVSVVIH